MIDLGMISMRDLGLLIDCRFGEVKCDVFDGHGSLARGGFHKRNHVAIERLVGELLL